MTENDDKLMEYYSFFKKKFDIDFNKMSEEKILLVINNINKILDKELKKEKLKQRKLIIACHNKINQYQNLSKQLLEIVD